MKAASLLDAERRARMEGVAGVLADIWRNEADGVLIKNVLERFGLDADDDFGLSEDMEAVRAAIKSAS